MTTKVLLFDLGGVLVENDTFLSLAELTNGSPNDPILRDRWLLSPSVRSYERGRIDSVEFSRSFVAEWQLGITPDDFAARFRRWPKGPFTGVDVLLARLRQSYVVGFLSNCNDLHWQRLAPMLSWADHAFSSHLIGAVKPDNECFQHVVGRLGVEPNEIAFFDDSEANVKAARAVGINAHQTNGFSEVLAVIDSLQL